jgi:hypothetical protein
MNFKETWAELEKLHEWKYMNPPKAPAAKAQNTNATTEPESNTPKKYRITYREEEDGFLKTLYVTAKNEKEAEEIAWSTLSVDEVLVTEMK